MHASVIAKRKLTTGHSPLWIPQHIGRRRRSKSAELSRGSLHCCENAPETAPEVARYCKNCRNGCTLLLPQKPLPSLLARSFRTHVIDQSVRTPSGDSEHRVGPSQWRG